MADILTNIYDRLISDEIWEGTETNPIGFSDEKVKLHTDSKTLEVVKNKLRQAMNSKNDKLIPLNAESDLSQAVGFCVEPFTSSQRELSVFLFVAISEGYQAPLARVLLSKCACCDDMSISVNPNAEVFYEVESMMQEYIDRIYMLTAAWCQLIKESEKRKIH